MKCQSCGADIKIGAKFCEFCGSSISADMKREQEYINKAGCPKCGSSNITFDREKQGEIKGKKGTTVVRATIGVCKDCGHTWQTQDGNQPKKKRKTWLWVLGWIFLFPVPLTILMLRKKDMNPIIKYGIIAAGWALYLLIGLGGNSNKTGTTAITDPAGSGSAVVDTTIQGPANKETHIYDNADIVDLMNGLGTKKIGTITVTKANRSDCTDEVLIDWYFNYVKNDPDSNYHLIVYRDVEQKGVYAMGGGFIQKDVELVAEENGSYRLGDDAGSTYFTVDESAKSLIVRMVMADAAIVEEAKSKVDAVIPSEYKNSDFYTIDVGGAEGSLDCNLTLVNESFATADFQSIAAEMATKVKDLKLGIGYFCIVFQSDDYTMTAISSLDDLSTQEATEISTKNFK